MSNPYQDRGHKKWGGLFLPEHRERLQQWVSAQSLPDRPIRGIDQLEDLNCKLHQYLNDHSTVKITFFKNQHFQDVIGVLHSCDSVTRILVVYDTDYQKITIQLKDVHNIEFLK